MTFIPRPRLGGNAILWPLLAAGLCGPLFVDAQTVVDLGAASSFGVLAATTVTSTGLTVVDGNLGLTNGSVITGFAGYGAGGTGVVNGSFEVENGLTTQAASALSSAYSALGAETATVTGLSAFAGQTLAPGVYNAPTSLAVSGVLTLDGQGQANPVFVFQIGSMLNVAVGTQIVLTGGATAGDIFWQVGSSATLGGAVVFDGNLLTAESIGLGLGETVDGRLLAINGEVTFGSDNISAVPEPATTALIFAGCALLAAGVKRRFGSKADGSEIL